MTLTTWKNQNRLKLFLISIIFITLGIILVVFVGYRHVLNMEDKPVTIVQSKANISIRRAHQTATRDGIKEWSLDAASVDYMNQKKQAVFHDLSVTFYLKNNINVHIKADQGILKTDSNDMEIFGNVVVKNKRYRLTCEKLVYRHNARSIFSKTPVNITGEGFNLVADSMSLDLNTNRAVFEGKVKGTLNERIIL